MTANEASLLIQAFAWICTISLAVTISAAFYSVLLWAGRN